MADLVKIPVASAEYVARFDRPYVGLIAGDRPRVFEVIVAALLPFKFRLADSEIISVGTPADHKIIFRLPERGITFQFGAEEYKFTKDQSSWATVDEDAKVLVAIEQALLEASGTKVQSCAVTLGAHMQVVAKRRDEILAPFAPEPFKKLMGERKAETFGCHIKFADGDVLVDFSLAYANGIFIRLTSRFQGKPPLKDILAKVRHDEETLLQILGVEEEINA